MRKRRLATVLTLLGIALLAACNDGDMPIPSPSPTTSAPQPTATTSPTRTPQPTTQLPTPTALFCDAEQDSLDGLEYVGDGNNQHCDDGGFVLDTLPAAAAELAAGNFVPRCFQSADGGLRLVVSRLCILDGPTPTFTTDPRPPEVKDQIENGDLVPFCEVDLGNYPDYPILVGPPCVLGGEGYASITVNATDIALASDCTAGFTYFSLSETALRQLLGALPTDASGALDLSGLAITEAGTVLSAPAPERVARFFAPWGDQSPIEMNAAIVTALEALENGDPAAIEALRTQIQDAINWYSAGRGC